MQVNRLLRGLAIIGAMAGLTGPQNLALSPPEPTPPSPAPLNIVDDFTPPPRPKTVSLPIIAPSPQNDSPWTLQYETSLTYPLRPGPAPRQLDIPAMVRETLAELNRPQKDFYDADLDDAMMGIMRGRNMSAYIKKDSHQDDPYRLKIYNLNFIER
jgi:hypothetical protein